MAIEVVDQPMSERRDRGRAVSAVEARDVGFTYAGGSPVLSGVDLVVQPGSLTAITGPSGSGKSTLMHCMAGLLPVHAGEVQILGCDVHHLGEPERTTFRRSHLGFVFQQPGLLEDLKAVDNVAIAGWAAGMGRRAASRRARERLDEVGLGEFGDRLPGELSGGQAQRVGVARALMNDPEVVFADEPTGALDRSAGGEVIALLRRAADLGAAVVLVTHDQELASTADHELALVDGSVVGYR